MKSIIKHRNDKLTKDDELELGRKIQAGLRAKEQLGETNEELQKIIAEGEAAYETLISNYIDLARKLAHTHAKRTGTRYSVEDLIQDALVALCNAALTYDPDKNCKLSTHAYYGIAKKLSVRINEERFVRLPENKMGEYYLIRKAETKWESLVDPEISKNEFVSDETGLDISEIELIHQIMQPIVSFQATINDNNGELMDIIPGDKPVDLNSGMVNTFAELENEQAVQLIKSLTPFERDLIAFEFAVFPASMTYEDFLVKYNMTDRDVIRETRRAIRKMKKQAASKGITK